RARVEPLEGGEELALLFGDEGAVGGRAAHRLVNNLGAPQGALRLLASGAWGAPGVEAACGPLVEDAFVRRRWSLRVILASRRRSLGVRALIRSGAHRLTTRAVSSATAAPRSVRRRICLRRS